MKLKGPRKEAVLLTLGLWAVVSEALELLEWNVAVQSQGEGGSG